jgi:hypothetical protein
MAETQLALARLREREGPIAAQWEGEGRASARLVSRVMRRADARTLTRLADARHPLPLAGEGFGEAA